MSVLLSEEEIEFARARHTDVSEWVDWPLEWDGGVKVEEEEEADGTTYRYVYVSECSYLGDTMIMLGSVSEGSGQACEYVQLACNLLPRALDTVEELDRRRAKWQDAYTTLVGKSAKENLEAHKEIEELKARIAELENQQE
jgi:hypothetical protein